VYYRLTNLGLSLETLLAALRAWAEKHTADIGHANNVDDAQADTE
jgi:DNA-binding HxlR family transcriptional regulator